MVPLIELGQVLISGLKEVGSDKNIYIWAQTKLKVNPTEEYVTFLIRS